MAYSYSVIKYFKNRNCFSFKFLLSFMFVPITVAARSKVRTVFFRLNTEIVGSNPIQGMDVCIAFILCLCCPVCR
jgi:hypothetical protein